MLLSDDAKALHAIDREAAAGAPLGAVLTRLRGQLSLDAFGLFMISLPQLGYPALSRLLPRMADDQVQRNFTGASGEALLGQTVNFVRALGYNYAALRHKSLSGARILDFGCGYGRISRLMYYYVDPDALWMMDPWDEAIDLCRAAGMLGSLARSEYLPDSLPAPDGGIDLAFALSVFTHTSLRATRQALRALRRCMTDNGLLCITIRPPEYWRALPEYAERAAGLEDAHARHGFAFAPHGRAPIDGDVTYGDTSMTLEFIQSNFPEWKIVATDWAMVDTYQRYVYLSPA